MEVGADEVESDVEPQDDYNGLSDSDASDFAQDVADASEDIGDIGDDDEEDIEETPPSSGGDQDKVEPGVSRDRQTWKRVLILSCRFLADGFENRVEITKFVDNFILFQENSNN